MKLITLSASIVLTLLLFPISPADVAAESVVPRFEPQGLATAGKAEAPVRPPAAPGSGAEAGRTLNEYQRGLLERFLAGSAAREDTLRIIAVQVQFADSLMGGREGGRAELHDSLYFANELKHVEQYYAGASRGRLTIRWDVTGRIYNLPGAMGYYGDDREQDTRAVEMMRSVIDSSDDDVDFSRYDTVMLVHAGAGQETDVLDNSRTQLWSSFYSRADIDDAFPDSTVWGLRTNDSREGEPFLVDNFMLVPESASQDDFTIGSLGIWVFEVASRLGLLPLSDSTPAGRPDSRGAGGFDVMAAGLYNGHVVVDEFSRVVLYPGFVPCFPSVLNRVIAGWIDPLVVEETGSYRIRDINSPVSGDTACIKIRITESEYYLVVNRVHDTDFDSLFTFGDFDNDFWPDNEDSLGGAEFDFFLTVQWDPLEVRADPDFGGAQRVYVHTGSGMYIWHVDETVIWQTLMTGYLPNDFVSRKGTDLEEADGVQDLDGTGSFSLGGHYDSFRRGSAEAFGPDTQPSTVSNSGARTGIAVKDISKTGPMMTCSIEFAPAYEETRTRWSAGANHQPPSLVDLNGDGDLEIVVLADTAHVFAFAAGAAEFVDVDGDPSTIDPYISAPGARWIGPPAFGDIDGDSELEIVACDERGVVYAWNTDGSEVFDGDGDPLTTGVLYRGNPLASPPMLVDVNGDGTYETVFVERVGVTLAAGFVDGEGVINRPSGADFHIVWGAPPVQAQFASPLAFGALGTAGKDTEGVAFAWADTLDGYAGFSYLPIRFRGAPSDLVPVSYRWRSEAPLPAEFPAASSIAVGDLDGNGFDEAVFTLSDGRLVVWDWQGQGLDPDAAAPNPITLVELRSTRPSAPALGDADGDGTLEILFWDDDYFYLYEHNARIGTNWPQPLRQTTLGDYPRLAFDTRLTSPLVGNVDGDAGVEILFPRGDGAVFGFDAGGTRLAGFPRAAPDGIEATPSIGDLNGTGDLSLVTLGVTTPFVAIDAVGDSIAGSSPVIALSVQTFPGGSAGGNADWLSYQRGLTRQGRWVRSSAPQKSASAVEPGSFKIYPNPVRGADVRARIVLNAAASVRAEIYNMEGERAASLEAAANSGGVIHTPFDEAIDVSALKSGVYMLRLVVTTASGSESLVGSFAILR